MKLTLYLLLGSAFILVGIFALYIAAGLHVVLVPRRSQQVKFDPDAAVVGVPRLLRRLRHAGRHLPVPHLVARRPRLGADRRVDAARRRADEARRLRRRAPRHGPAARRRACSGRGSSAAIACINIVYGALCAMSQKDLKYVVAYSSVSHMGIVMLGAATLTESGLNGAVFQMFAHGIMTGLFFALVGLVYEKAHSREIFKMGGFATMMPGIAAAFTIGGLSSLGLPATAGLRRRVPGVPRRVAVGALVVAVPGRDRRVPHVASTCCASCASRSSGDRRARTRTSRTCLTRRAPSGSAIVLLVFVIVLFGVAAGPGDWRRLTPRPCRSCIATGGAVMSALVLGTRRRRSALEGGVFGLLLVVLLIGLFRHGPPEPAWPAGWRLSGLAALVGAVVHRRCRAAPRSAARSWSTTWRCSRSGCSSSRRRSACSRRSALPAAALSRRSTPSITSRCSPRCSGMLVLASARELVLLFVAVRADVDSALLPDRLPEAGPDAAPEGALKFFLVGSVSSAVVLYGISFVYGATGSTAMCGDSRRRSWPAIRWLMLGPRPDAGRPRLQDRRRAVPHVGAGHLRSREHAVRRVVVGGAQGRGLRRHLPPLCRRRRARPR